MNPYQRRGQRNVSKRLPQVWLCFEAHRRHLPTDKYDPNNNFVNIVKRMLELGLKTEKAHKLKEQLLESRHYTDRNWLLTKLDAFIQKAQKQGSRAF